MGSSAIGKGQRLMARREYFVPCDPSRLRVGDALSIHGDFSFGGRPQEWEKWSLSKRSEWICEHGEYRPFAAVKVGRERVRLGPIQDESLAIEGLYSICASIFAQDWPAPRLGGPSPFVAQRLREERRFEGRVLSTYATSGGAPGVVVEFGCEADAKWIRLRNFLHHRGPSELMTLSALAGAFVTMAYFQTALLPTWLWLAALAASAGGILYARTRGASW